MRIIEQACLGPQEGGEVTQIDYFSVVGTPIGTTNMNDFKRVQGKKGEAHWRTRGKNIPRIFSGRFFWHKKGICVKTNNYLYMTTHKYVLLISKLGPTGNTEILYIRWIEI